MAAPDRIRVNVGCGYTPTPGWVNLDNSLTVRLAPVIRRLAKVGVVPSGMAGFADVAAAHGIRWCDASRRLPFADGSVDAIYTSHMFEHLGTGPARRFLAEALRVLVPGGILRVAVPDLRLFVQDYVARGDADAFVARTQLAAAADGFFARLKALLLGARERHLWMYDAASLCRLLGSAGFESPQALPPGTTGLEDPGSLNLAERPDESCYVEGRKPG